MKTTIFRLLNLLLCLSLCLGMFPGVAWAETVSDPLSYLTYEISDGGVFITDCEDSITGELDIPDTIEGFPVTGIGNSAFSDCTGLTSITIPDSITSIGLSAFYYCISLTGITIPGGVTSIGYGAFYYCNSLTSITIPDSVISIDSLAFSGCSKLNHVFYTGTQEQWDAITVESGNTSLTSTTIHTDYEGGGYTYTTSCTTVRKQCDVCGCTISATSGGNGHQFVENVCIVCGVLGNLVYNVSNTGIVTITGCDTSAVCELIIPATIEGFPVTGIGNTAFQRYTDLTDITIPDSVISIGSLAFSGCSKLNHVFYTGTQEQWDAITVKSGNTLLTSATIHTDCESTGYTCTTSCTAVRKQCNVCGDTISSVSGGSGHQFVDNICTACGISDSLEYTVSNAGDVTITGCDPSVAGELIIPDTIEGCPVTKIGNKAFEGCTNLNSITIPGGVITIGNQAFYNCTGLTGITIQDGVTGIGGYAFSGCTNLTGITIPDSVTTIGNQAFYNCTGLTDITIGSSVAAIEGSAFSRCNRLNHVFYTGTQAQWDAITIESGNTLLASATVHTDCEGVGYTMEAYCTITRKQCNLCGDTISFVSGGNGHQFVENVCSVCDLPGSLEYTVSNAGDVTITGCDSSITGELIIPDTIEGCPVTKIGNEAFKDCTGLIGITIPDSVTSFGWYAFQNCTGLGSVNMPDSVTSIGGYAFSGCTNLTGITIPDSVTDIDGQAFYNCIGLTSVDIQNIGAWCTIRFVDYASNPLYYAKTLCLNGTTVTNLFIPDEITSVGDYAFYHCSGLSSITIPDSVTTIGRYAFSGCTNLTGITIPDSVTSIGESAFYNCSGLTDITIPEGVTSIRASVFRNCTNLTGITIPDSVTSIGEGAFFNCTNMSNIIIPDSVTTIGSRAFYNCTGLTSITIPDSVTSIGEGAFSNCANLSNVTIPNSVTSIGRYAFSGCTGLTSITIPDGITTIGDYTFSDCASLTGITIPDSVTSIGEFAFSDCVSLTYITIPDSVTSVGRYAFSDCTSLADINIGSSVTAIEHDAFSGCSQLNHVFYTGTQEQWDAITIDYNNTKLESATTHTTCEGNEYTYMTYCTAIHKRCNLCDAIISNRPGGAGHSFNGGVCTICGLPNGLEYAISVDGKAQITGLDASWSGELVIPDTIEGCPVTGIGESAFSGCTSLTSITIPDSVTDIDRQAFYNCTGLTNITIPDSVTGIGSYAFYNCNGLTSVTIQGNVTSAGESVFGDCERLREFIFEADAPADLFVGVLADVCYPEDNSSWTETVTEGYSGNLTFYAIGELVDLKIRNGVYLTGFPVDADDLDLVAVYSNGVQRPLYSSLFTFTPIDVSFAHATSTVITYNDFSVSHAVPVHDWQEVLVDSALNPYPESSHPYYANTDDTQTFTVPGAYSLKLTFSDSTWLAWDAKIGGDEVLIYNSRGEEIGNYYGNKDDDECENDPAGQTLTIMDDTVKVRLVTNDTEWLDNVRGYGYSFSQIAALMPVHSSETTIPGIAPTCTQDGYTGGYNCDICGCLVSQQVIPALGHDYVSVVTPATPDSYGYTTHTCRRCGDTYIDGINAYKQIANGELSGGDHLYWILHENGTLEIGGSGYMPNFSSYGAPWYKYINEIRCIQVNDGVNSIGTYAFENCAALSVTLGNSVTVIGDGAFIGCDWLEHTLYMGSQQQWEAIIKGDDNQLLNTPAIHFNCTGNEVTNSLSCTAHQIQCTICEKIMVQWVGAGHSYIEGTCIHCGEQEPSSGTVLVGTITSFGDETGCVTVELWEDGAAAATYSTVLTGSDAVYAFEQLSAGTYTLRISKAHHTPREYELTIGDESIVLSVNLCLIGDISGDGKVNVGDVAKLYAHIRKIAELTDEYQLECANVNGGIVNIGDVASLYAHIRGTKKLY